MKVNEAAEQLIASGIPPLDVTYEKVSFFDGADPVYRTRLVFNSLEIGTLSYDTYRYVAARTRQGNHIVKRHLAKLFGMLSSEEPLFRDARCFTFPVHAKMLHEGELSAVLAELDADTPLVSASSVCVEVSADMLFENTEKIEKELSDLRTMGCRIAISEIGTEFSPAFRLAKFRFDYAILDASVVKGLTNDDAERAVGGIISYLHHLGARVIAPCLTQEEQIATAKKIQCDGFSSFAPQREEEQTS